MRAYLDAETWAAFAATYVGSEPRDNWAALFATIELFRRVAVDVGQALGYDYPHGMDARVTTYMRQVQRLDEHANERKHG